MRPPYGDIDDRVRYISLKLGLRPIIWTTHNGATFGKLFSDLVAGTQEVNGSDLFSGLFLVPDTRDWQIGGGVVSATDAYMNFDRFLDQAVSQLNTGFIVLAHDLVCRVS